jgi:alpha-mannosidase
MAAAVLTYFPRGYNNVLNPLKMAGDLAAYAPSTKYPEMLYLFGVGDHGGGPTRAMLQTAGRWRKDAVYPRLSMGTSQPYFDNLAKQAPTMDLPVWNNELYLEFHRGVYTTQAQTKKANRRSEELLETTEKFSSLASLFGNSYPKDDLRRAWKKVLFNQFHDIAAGSGIPAVHQDAARDYAEAGRIGREHLQQALGEVLVRVDTNGKGEPVAVFNPLSWKRTDIVETEVQLPEPAQRVEVLDSHGTQIPAELLSKAGSARVALRFLATDVPSLGYKIFRVVATTQEQKPGFRLKFGPDFIENEFYRVRIDPKTGCITSVWDKTTNWETIEHNGCGNQMQAFADNPREYDAWNIDADFEKQQWTLNTADEVKLVEKGPLRAVLRVRRHFQHSTFVQDITVATGVRRVDIVTHADWHEKHILLKAAFPVSVHSNTAVYEIPFGSISRPTTRNTPAERAKFEVSALRWADLSDHAHGMSLLNDSKYGYDCKGNMLRLTLLRSPAWPDPHADEGTHDFTYSLYPHGTDKVATTRSGYELNSRLLAAPTISHAGTLPPEHSFVSIEPANVVITALKQSEDGSNLILRFYEFAGQKTNARVTLPDDVEGVYDANLMEAEDGRVAFDGGQAKITVGPCEIKTLQVHLRK